MGAFLDCVDFVRALGGMDGELVASARGFASFRHIHHRLYTVHLVEEIEKQGCKERYVVGGCDCLCLDSGLFPFCLCGAELPDSVVIARKNPLHRRLPVCKQGCLRAACAHDPGLFPAGAQ